MLRKFITYEKTTVHLRIYIHTPVSFIILSNKCRRMVVEAFNEFIGVLRNWCIRFVELTSVVANLMAILAEHVRRFIGLATV